MMCRLYGVTRAGYYAWKCRGQSQRRLADETLGQKIETIHRKSRCLYGSPRVHDQLRKSGIRVGRKRVERLMRSRGLKARCARIYRLKPGVKKFFDSIPNHSYGIVCQWERKSVPVTGIEKCTTPWERTSQSGEAEIVESPPFWESCLAKA
ncbi:IS3 family transposase [Geobacter hydrogenophilus]|uniref:HTH-like domain-containing protein n=2 Tax=Geobacter hydrogenophilus TaxID=40983 RepID=A0A9W6FY67_9BACT|nr:IS3 family transposase [Geobacter hydrogenophilus]GLI36977.1 hypothetical protein GHYDROH2_04780 [Geobacter hydrogenophilus]